MFLYAPLVQPARPKGTASCPAMCFASAFEVERRTVPPSVASKKIENLKGSIVPWNKVALFHQFENTDDV
jgi:hypothetical protein